MAVGSVGSVGSVTSTSNTVATDPRDLDRDGKVTALEIQQYNLTHPEADTAQTAQTKSNSLLDLTV